MQLIIYNRLYFFAFVVLNSFIYPQEINNSISGKIIDGSNNKFLSSVNVYLSGTTWGAVTDGEGFYKISSVKPGKYELIVSIVGYEVITKSINLFENSMFKFDFKLKQKSYELNPIEIISDRPKEWQDNLETFKSFFLGQNKFAADCVIKNELKLDFEKIGNNVLSARIDEPIIIINRSLGFKIYCILLNFYWDSEERRIKFEVKPRFEELIALSVDEKTNWINNRKKVYESSLTRFLRSLINDDFLGKGYKIYLNYLPIETKNTTKLEQVFVRSKLLKQSAIAGEYDLQFENYLRVVYNNQASWIKLCYPEVTLDKFGNPEEPIPFETYGYWSNSGMADMLPSNYESNGE
jgi:hypothetical protein